MIGPLGLTESEFYFGKTCYHFGCNLNWNQTARNRHGYFGIKGVVEVINHVMYMGMVIEKLLDHFFVDLGFAEVSDGLVQNVEQMHLILMGSKQGYQLLVHY